MITDNHFYNRLNNKALISLIAITILYFIFCVVTCFNISEELDFYRHAKHTSSVVKNIKSESESDRIIRVAYIVDKKSYTKDITYNEAELGQVEIGDTVNIFYNSKKPGEASITTRTVGSVYVMIILLVMILIILVLYIIYHIMRSKINVRLIEEDNYIMARFSRLEFRTSYNPLVNGRVNRVYCKAKIDNKKYMFKSVLFTEKPKPLNDTSMIKVYIDKNNSNNYLVSLEDVIEDSVKKCSNIVKN